jgi:hypothetical protein
MIALIKSLVKKRKSFSSEFDETGINWIHVHDVNFPTAFSLSQRGIVHHSEVYAY